MTAISDTLKETLNQAAEIAFEQEKERREAQEHLLDSLTSIESHVGVVWTQLGILIYIKLLSVNYYLIVFFLTEESVAKLMTQQEYASHMQSETVETLQRFNQTFQFLLSVSENSRDQLNWILGVVQKIGSSCSPLLISLKTKK